MSGLFNDDTLSLYLKLKEAMKQYVRDAFGGSLNPEVPNYPGLLAAQAKAQQNTLRDAWGDPNKMADATLGMMNGAMGSFLPFGITAWHGSPHKFDKFSLDKIGTGEGAQAYGHGLYLAESPGVAKDYRYKLSAKGEFPNVNYKGEYYASGNPELSGTRGEAVGLIAEALRKDRPVAEAIQVAQDIAKKRFANDVRNVRSAGMGTDDFLQSPEAYKSLLREIKGIDPSLIQRVGDPKEAGNLYKTDIPDEAVARFLDWDKPLSEQAKEVQAALAKTKNKQLRAMVDYANVPHSEAIGGEAKTMGEAFRLLNLNLHGKSSADSVKASALLAKQGIPGIRYLDGGSRGAGTGTSNYVVFDPEMIRILERNGEATGAKPWQPGEWEGLFKK